VTAPVHSPETRRHVRRLTEAGWSSQQIAVALEIEPRAVGAIRRALGIRPPPVTATLPPRKPAPPDLPAFANPAPADFPSPRTRDVWCRSAYRCLCVAEDRGWAGLSCVECPRRGRDQEDKEAAAAAIGRAHQEDPEILAPGYSGAIGAVSRRLSEALRARGAPLARDLMANGYKAAAAARRRREVEP
jgi:hypothetical protein